jgi:hypothetical protein
MCVYSLPLQALNFDIATVIYHCCGSSYQKILMKRPDASSAI